jgi:membrane-associated phospholipid phosphatase
MIAAHLAPIRLASRDFLARWRSRERESATSGRQIEAFLALFICGLIVLVAWLGDERIAYAMRDLPDSLRRPLLQITKLGESGWIFALAIAVLGGALFARHRGLGLRLDAALGLLAGRAFFIVAVNAASGLLSLVVKTIVGRARPRLLDMVGPFHFDLFSVKSALLSFPSGHAVTALATATALAFIAPRAGWPAFVLALLICISRVATGAHYPSDVIGGMALGFATTIFARRAFADRGIVFRSGPSGIVLRGAGMVGPALRTIAGRWKAKAVRSPE